MSEKLVLVHNGTPHAVHDGAGNKIPAGGVGEVEGEIAKVICEAFDDCKIVSNKKAEELLNVDDQTDPDEAA